jgi:hypothetical protein
VAAAGGRVLGTVLIMVPPAVPATDPVPWRRRFSFDYLAERWRCRWPNVAPPARRAAGPTDLGGRRERRTMPAGWLPGPARAGDEPISLATLAERRAAPPAQRAGTPDRSAPAVDA